MDAKKLTFTDRQYVCVTRYPVWDKDKPELGFAAPYIVRKSDGEPTASTKKRIETIQSWGYSFDYETRTRIPGTFEILDNKPTTGFTLLQTISRWTTDNKLFRVLDPRGFTLEIYCGNLMHLIKHCTIIKGVIKEPLMWSDDMQLVTAEDYGISKAYQSKDFIDVNTIPIGSEIFIDEQELPYVWLGRHHCFWRKYSGTMDGFSWSSGKRNVYMRYAKKGKHTHEFWYDETKTKVERVGDVVEQHENVLSYINSKVPEYMGFSIVFFSDRKEDIEVTFKEVHEEISELDTFIVKLNDNYYFAQYHRSYYDRSYYDRSSKGRKRIRFISIDDRSVEIKDTTDADYGATFDTFYDMYVNGHLAYESPRKRKTQ